jgi:hypothetical protein
LVEGDSTTLGLQAYAGVPAGCGYPACTNLDYDNVSERHWIANSPYDASNKVYNYDYFLGLVPANVVYGTFPTGAAAFYGYEWYKSAGNLAVNATAIGTRKVILYVGRNLMVNGNITITSVMS